MERQITLEKVASNLESALGDVRDRHDQLVIVHEGKRVLAMIPIEFYDRWFAERKNAFRYLDQLPTHNTPYSDEEVEADVEQAIREVRVRDAVR